MMMPNETVTREEFEKLFSDPRMQLSVLNLRIEFLRCEIAQLSAELQAMELRRKALIEEVLK